jgi:biopolymer transport protein ExbB/TolQ
MQFILEMGMFRIPLIILALVVVGLSIKKFIDLSKGKDLTPARGERGLHAILFWGGISAVLGILGQTSGLYNALSAIGRAKQIDPTLVARGFAESFTTTLFGLTVFFFSGIIWFVLFSKYRKLAARKE